MLSLDFVSSSCYNNKRLNFFFFPILFYFYFYFIFLDLGLGVSMILHMIVTYYHISQKNIIEDPRTSNCYKLKILKLVKNKNLVLVLTQENLIEFLVQNHLPYIH